MKFLILSLLFSFAVTAQAQNVGVKVNDVDASGDQETTISIKKGSKTVPGEAKYEITEGTDEMSGDPAALQKEARANWKKACTEWKQELKELNAENKVLTMNCGQPQCSTSSMETVCKSTTKYKLKVRVN